jgi:RHS repeat-associated protein
MRAFTPAVDRYGLTSHDFSASVGLNPDGVRSSDAAIGRLIGRDTLGFDAGDANLYRYVKNAPTRSTDPTGRGPLEEQKKKDIKKTLDDYKDTVKDAIAEEKKRDEFNMKLDKYYEDVTKINDYRKLCDIEKQVISRKRDLKSKLDEANDRRRTEDLKNTLGDMAAKLKRSEQIKNDQQEAYVKALNDVTKSLVDGLKAAAEPKPR